MNRMLLLTVALWTAATAVCPAQIAMQDALRLRPFVEEVPGMPGVYSFMGSDSAIQAYMRILLHYTTGKNQSTGADILEGLADNPYINDAEKSPAILLPFTADFKADDVRAPQAILFSMAERVTANAPGGFFVTNVADGLARFLVARTKEELNMAFFRDFRDWLQANRRYTRVFPATTDVIATLGEDVSYQYQLYLQTLREAFRRDMKSLPDNLALFLTSGDLLRSADSRVAVRDVLHLSQMLIDNQTPDSLLRYCANSAYVQHPDEILEATAAAPDSKTRLQRLAGGLKIANLISESVRAPEGAPASRIWMDPDRLAASLRDDITMQLYMGLLYQQAAKLHAAGGPDIRPALASAATLTTLRTRLRVLAEYGREVAATLEELRHRPQDESPTYDVYYRFFSASFAVIGTAFDIKDALLGSTDDQQNYERRYMKSIQHLNELNLDVRRKQYTAAVTDLVALLDLLVFDLENPKERKIRSGLLRYGNFIAVVAQSETSEDVTAALEAVALPPGSSAVKKHNAFSVAINAYTGVAGGAERLQVESAERQEGFVAVSAPVGLTFSWALGGPWQPSFSVYTPILDVGALAAYRFDNTTEKLPELSWNNLVAPGLYGVFGFGNDLPISVGFGAQLGPNLRRITAGQADVTAQAWRWGGFFSVDIPLFNLYVR